MEVIHDWPDAEAVAILKAVRRAAPPGATVLIIENVLAGVRADPRGRTLDVIMLAVTGGRERTGPSSASCSSGPASRVADVLQTAGPLRIVEAATD